ncbi:Protein yceI precursor [hydrothermal vent metagenome]|uniref:Protein yceI n=1 Tax=hydrothermal vent metagenome TaxID=652676 RepID=A0A3B0VX91_9ZZZZ
MKYLLIGLLLTTATFASADKYTVDTKGAHAFVQFKIKHLGFSWLYGRFDSFSGEFDFDEANPEKASIEMTIETNSVNSNHTARDKHLRGDDFLNVDANPTATFKSKSFMPTENGHGKMIGDLTINGVTNEETLSVEFIGGGKDPWGGNRRGYEATAEITLSDYKIKKSLGPAAETLLLTVSVEGIKQ